MRTTGALGGKHFGRLGKDAQSSCTAAAKDVQCEMVPVSLLSRTAHSHSTQTGLGADSLHPAQNP